MPTSERSLLNRSYLFAPGSNPRVLSKVLDAGADAVILDLEDAVPLEQKEGARTAISSLIVERAATARCGVFVRISMVGGIPCEADLAAACRPGIDGIVLSKCESPQQVESASAILAQLEQAEGLPPGYVRIIPLIETAAGVLNASNLATSSSRIPTLTLGGIDLLADLGGGGGPAGPATQYARSHLVVATRAAGLSAPIDTVFPLLEDEAGLAAATRDAATLGYFGKLVIHPKQLAAVHQAFTPGPNELQRAQRIIEAFETAQADGHGAVTLDGEFIDPPVLRRAVSIIQLAERLGLDHRKR